MTSYPKIRHVWFSRLLIGLVFFFNVQCAVVFLIWPDAFSPGFGLTGAIGAGVVRGMGILFLMWNVPYGVALTDPLRRRNSLMEAVAMQVIGLVGETLLLATFPPGYDLIRATMERFILFDGFGLVALLLAAGLPVEVG